MHLHFERTSLARTDCNVLSLTWMGKVPDELPDDEGWKLNRMSYYQDGWLATGNARGIVGVTFTTCFFRKTSDLPLRTNYNLRGHRSEVTLVKWNEPYQKLASCDSSGIIFVWIKYEGRWSIELINDRSTKVTDFCWSHDGRMALICYQDGFVLVGSVAGQRYWSSMLNLDSTITCGIWAPDDQQVLFGTSNGQILVIDVHGVMVAQVSIQDGMPIASMCWSCEKFKMEETDEEELTLNPNPASAYDSVRQQTQNRPSVLALCFQNGTIYLMKNYDDISPTMILTGLKGVKMEWSNNGEILAVAGVSESSLDNDDGPVNCVQFYTEAGSLRFVGLVPYSQSPITALTWGHNDKRLFVATGSVIHIGWVTRRIASLQLLSRLTIHNCLRDESNVQKLPLPRRLKAFISNLFGQTIKCYLPEPKHLRDFVSKPPSNGIRLHCTMIRHNDDAVSGNATYTLFLEYLGGLVPLLKGKRASKIRPEFIIFDPEIQSSSNKVGFFPSQLNLSGAVSSSPLSSTHSSARVSPHPNSVSTDLSSSDSEVDEGCASPRLQRRRRKQRNGTGSNYNTNFINGGDFHARQELVYLDDLPENQKLVAVSSNIWGTKFKLLGLTPWLPSSLGTISYRTSLLHLQPRQMTLVMKELNGPESLDTVKMQVVHHLQGPNSSAFGGHISFSEDEDDIPDEEAMKWDMGSSGGAPVAPMTPQKRQQNQRTQQLNSPVHRFVNSSSSVPLSPSIGRVKSKRRRSVDAAMTDDELEDYTKLNSVEDFLSVQKVLESTKTEDSDKDASVISSSLEDEENNRKSIGTSIQSFVDVLKNDENLDALETKNNFVIFPTRTEEGEKKKQLYNSDPLGLASNSGSSGIRRSRGDTNLTGSCETVPRWAEKVGDLKFIDDDLVDDPEIFSGATVSGSTTVQSNGSLFLLGHRSRSVGHLQMTEFATGPMRSESRVHAGSGALAGNSNGGPSFKDQRRLTLKSRNPGDSSNGESQSEDLIDSYLDNQCKINSNCNIDNFGSAQPPPRNGYVRSLINSSAGFLNSIQLCGSGNNSERSSATSSSEDVTTISDSLGVGVNDNLASSACSSSGDVTRLVEHRASLPHSKDQKLAKANGGCSGLCGPTLLNGVVVGASRSIPSSPVSKRKDGGQRKGFLYSPRLARRTRRQKLMDSSDEDASLSGDDVAREEFTDLESFQKAYIRKKLKKWRGRAVADGQQESSPSSSNYREFVLHNKAPLWNEVSQVYQLDFGGRVTQESAKNFQIEFRGKQTSLQVMQFGRIDGNAYTLDFQYPFCALQAFAVALANVTQRLK